MYHVTKDDTLEVHNSILYVNGKEFIFGEEDNEIISIEEDKLIMHFRGCECFRNEWNLEEIRDNFA